MLIESCLYHTHVSVPEVPDPAPQLDGLPGHRGHVVGRVLEVRPVLLEHGLVVAEVLVLAWKGIRGEKRIVY